MDLKKKRVPKLSKRQVPQTVGVRFSGKSLVYTYKIRPGAKVVPGDLLVAETEYAGPTIVFVVRVDRNPQVPPGFTLESLKWITQRVAPL